METTYAFERLAQSISNTIEIAGEYAYHEVADLKPTSNKSKFEVSTLLSTTPVWKREARVRKTS